MAKKSRSNVTLADVQHEIRQMTELMWELAEFGAADTESRWVWQDLLAKAVNGESPEVPTTANGWQLYTGEKGVGEAARKLAAKARGVLELINKLPLGQAGPLREFVESY